MKLPNKTIDHRSRAGGVTPLSEVTTFVRIRHRAHRKPAMELLEQIKTLSIVLSSSHETLSEARLVGTLVVMGAQQRGNRARQQPN